VRKVSIKLYDWNGIISYVCEICHTELLVKEKGGIGTTKSCPHYDAYTLSPSEVDECPEDRIEVVRKDYYGWRYVICRR
jgi:hypothetical protein